MQKDFHYYCIGILAYKAGFSQEDSLTIAHASQYIDDSRASKRHHFDDIAFEPARTSHVGLEAFKWNVQKKVYLPFHFLPEEATNAYNFSYKVKPLPELAIKLFKEAFTEPNKNFRLIRAGIALHTIADSYSHQGFSGIEDSGNLIINIKQKKKDGSWKDIKVSNFMPMIGHAQVLDIPDRPYLSWQFEYPEETLFDNVVEINNTERCMQAAEDIFNLLKSIAGNKSQEWDSFKDTLLELFSYHQKDLEKRCYNWQLKFNEIFKRPYDSSKWWNEMIPMWLTFQEWEKLRKDPNNHLCFPKRTNFGNANWVLFHKAAWIQRNFVLDHLPIDDPVKIS
ncbi:MAG: DUF6765 family protein [Cyanobacteriota bacterium]